MKDAETGIELSRVQVRLIVPGERAAWDNKLMREHHYLGLKALVGRSLRYVAQYEGRWLALLGWASAALKCAPRDAWIGGSGALQWQRLRLIANNSRLLLLPGPRLKNLASRILGLNLARLSEDWERVHRHGLVLAETFIDPSRFAGTCYRAANWREVGATRGFAASNQTYVEHGAAKRIWLFPLHPKEVERTARETDKYLVPVIQKLPGLTKYFAALSPTGSYGHISIWETDAHARQMANLKEMVIHVRKAAEAVGVKFIPIINYPIAWTISEGACRSRRSDTAAGRPLPT